MKCITCDYSVEDVKMMEDHCMYLGHTGYTEEGKPSNAVIQDKKELEK